MDGVFSFKDLWDFTLTFLLANPHQGSTQVKTQDLINRVAEHNQSETSSIKNGIPWKIVWSKEFGTRADAMALELKIKKRGAKRFLDDLSRGA